MEYNGVKYGYLQNLQGDIVGIIDSLGNEVVKYTYDAWGKPLSCTGTMAASLGKLNPFRYRGYVFDEETGLYYLRSRYYNPNNKRFLCADSLFIPCSLFAYGKNSAPNSIDYDGRDAIWVNSSDWVQQSGIPLGHTSLVIEYEGTWYYTMYAQNRMYYTVVPKSKMSDLKTFSKLVIPKDADYTYDSATYIFGDFSNAFLYFEEMSKKYPEGDPAYNAISNNCSTKSWDLLCMGTSPNGYSIKTLFYFARMLKRDGYKSPIPNRNNETIKRMFCNSSFTADEAKKEIMVDPEAGIWGVMNSQILANIKKVLKE